MPIEHDAIIIGGRLGASVAARIAQHVLERALGVLFILVAVIMLADVLI